jgi:hypothetical protein
VKWVRRKRRKAAKLSAAWKKASPTQLKQTVPDIQRSTGVAHRLIATKESTRNASGHA